MGRDGDGNDSPDHTIYLDGYWIYQTEVTNQMYALCVEAGECSEPGDGNYGNEDFAEYPAVYVSWYDAVKYCTWAGGSLPTEAQWEKAARGGLEGKFYPWGDEAPVCDLGAENGAQFKACDGETRPVGSFAPNGYGLYDMVGNASEWVGDYFANTYYASSPAQNPTGPDIGIYRTFRGGAWSDTAYGLFVTRRGYGIPQYSAGYYGFRCAVAIQP